MYLLSKKIAGFLPISLFLSIIISGACTRNVRETCPINPPDNGLKEIYSKEGFVSNDRFRVVIVQPVGKDMVDNESISQTARKRALFALKNYVLSQNGRITSNADAALLNIVNDNGKLSSQENDDRCATRKVFFYDIEKRNLRQQLNDIASRR